LKKAIENGEKSPETFDDSGNEKEAIKILEKYI
jgi:hypothetical protein